MKKNILTQVLYSANLITDQKVWSDS